MDVKIKKYMATHLIQRGGAKPAGLQKLNILDTYGENPGADHHASK